MARFMRAIQFLVYGVLENKLGSCMLNKCKECGGQVSSVAKACPHCGHSQNRQMAQGCGGLAAIGFLVLLAVGYCSDQSSNNKPAEKNAADVAELEKGEAAIANAMKDPQKVKLMECAGVKVSKDPQPAGHPPSTEECAQIEQDAGIPPDDVAKLITREKAVDEKCRGGSGDDTNTQTACNERDALFSEIKSKGWCWGPDNKAEYQKDWMPCAASSQ
jgi:ribosomal protein L32